MELITIDQLYELYNDTLSKCGVFLLKENDETIEYNIFEDFDIGVHSFLHLDNLKKLQLHGYISEAKLLKSEVLRSKVIELQNSGEWDIRKLKVSAKWGDVLLLCDELKKMK